MKKQHYILPLALVLPISLWAQSQGNEEGLNREMLIEKEFTPIVRDASKVIQLPAVESPVTNRKSEPQYSMQQQAGKPLYELVPLTPTAVDIAHDYSTQRGWATVGAGNYFNLNAAAGYALIDNNNSRLTASYDLFHTSGKRELLQSGEKEQFDLLKNHLNINLDQRIGRSRMAVYGDFRHSLFNLPTTMWVDEVELDKQAHTQYKVGVSVPDIRFGSFNLLTAVDYTRFEKRYFQPNDNGVAENYMKVQASTLGSLLGNIQGGLDMAFHYVGYNQAILNEAEKEYFILKVAPKVGFELERFRLMVGVNMEIQNRAKTQFKVTPDIHLNWDISKRIALFADMTGGSQLNTFERQEAFCRYLFADQRMEDNFVSLDLKAGLRSQFGAALTLELFGGYTRYDNMAYLTSSAEQFQKSLLLSSTASKVNRTYLGAKGRFVLSDQWNIRAAFEATRWGADEVNLALPTLEGNIGVSYAPIRKLRLNLDYYAQAGRKMDIQGAEEGVATLQDLHELRLGGSYQITRWLAANLQLNNLMNRKQELWYGIPEQGFNFLLGASFRF